MSDSTPPKDSEEKTYPATVVRIYNKYRVVINRGEEHGVELDQRFQLYAVTDEEIEDPNTGESLGRLEVPKGTGEVIYVQKQMATIHSDMEKSPGRTIIRRRPYALEEEEEYYPGTSRKKEFYNPEVGDFAKPI